MDEQREPVHRPRPVGSVRRWVVAAMGCCALGATAACGSASVSGPGQAELTMAASAASGSRSAGDPQASEAASGAPVGTTTSAPPSSSDAGPAGPASGPTTPAAPAESAGHPGVPPQAGTAAKEPTPASSRAVALAPSTSRTAARAVPARPSSTVRAPAAAKSSGSGLRTVAAGDSTGPALLTFGPGTPAAAEAEVIRLVNHERVEAGCPALAVNPLLVQVARAHSQEMALSGAFRHNSPDGRTPFQRLTAAGYRYSVATENIAAGQANASAVMSAWTASDEHLTNMLDCRLTQIGVGVVNRPGSQYGTYWTQAIATPM